MLQKKKFQKLRKRKLHWNLQIRWNHTLTILKNKLLSPLNKSAINLPNYLTVTRNPSTKRTNVQTVGYVHVRTASRSTYTNYRHLHLSFSLVVTQKTYIFSPLMYCHVLLSSPPFSSTLLLSHLYFKFLSCSLSFSSLIFTDLYLLCSSLILICAVLFFHHQH